MTSEDAVLTCLDSRERACELSFMKKSLQSEALATTPRSSAGFQERFRFCAHWVAETVGSRWAFVLACLTIVLWGAVGPAFHFSDTWQLVINTATTIVTFLMVFLIQSTQNRDTKAIHLKLDELLRGVRGARTSLINLESLSDEDLEQLQGEFERLKRRASPSENKKQAAA